MEDKTQNKTIYVGLIYAIICFGVLHCYTLTVLWERFCCLGIVSCLRNVLLCPHPSYPLNYAWVTPTRYYCLLLVKWWLFSNEIPANPHELLQELYSVKTCLGSGSDAHVFCTEEAFLLTLQRFVRVFWNLESIANLGR